MTAHPKVFIGIPHSGSLHEGLLSAALHPGRLEYAVAPSGFGCLTHNFNVLWCTALNGRAQGFTHFAMCHSDVAPQPGWVDLLLEEAERTGADVVSAVVALKSDRGLTSTGVGEPDSWIVRRLTMREVHALPATFSIEDVPDAAGKYLAINTGLWLCDLTRPWVERFPGFRVDNAISRDPVTGRFDAAFWPEDWDFAWWLHTEGLRAVATRKVRAIHHGLRGYSNETAWGEWETDRDYREHQARGE